VAKLAPTIPWMILNVTLGLIQMHTFVRAIKFQGYESLKKIKIFKLLKKFISLQIYISGNAGSTCKLPLHHSQQHVGKFI